MKIIIIRIIFIILILLNCSVTFGFSGQTGTESGGISRKVTLIVLNIFGDYEEPLTSTQEQYVKKAEHIVRKLAHFSIYALLGIWLMGLVSTFNISLVKKFGTSLLAGMLYASLDEFHQSFVPGRTAMITDVLIDTMGVITGILIVHLAIKIYTKYKKKQKQIIVGE